MKIFIALTFVAACQALVPDHVTGTTPPPVKCPNSLCNYKPDGNYEYRIHGHYLRNYFVQCSNGLASCQPCFPLTLEFSENCNQCLFAKNDECVSTQPWDAATTFDCPDKCPHRGPSFSGNIADPHNAHHYVACWYGQTVGCVPCPKGLKYNEKWNACLFKGLFKTQPSH